MILKKRTCVPDQTAVNEKNNASMGNYAAGMVIVEFQAPGVAKRPFER